MLIEMKKILGVILAVIAMTALFAMAVSAYSDANIDKAIEAALESKKTVVGWNDMTMDEFLSLVRKQVLV